MNTSAPSPASFAAVAMIALAAIAASFGLAGYGHEVTAPASEIVQLEPVEILGRHMPDGQMVSVTQLPTVIVTGSSSSSVNTGAPQVARASSAGEPRS